MTFDSIYKLLSQNNPPAMYYYNIAQSIIYNEHKRICIRLIPILSDCSVIHSYYYCGGIKLNITKILLHD